MLTKKWIGAIAIVVVGSCYAAAAGSAPVATLFPGELDWAGSPDWSSGSDNAPAFTADGKTVFFGRWQGGTGTIMVSHLVGGHWSTPEPAPFSATWRDIEPTMAPDGSYLVFSSNRPAAPGGQAIDGFFQGKEQPGKGGNLWRVDQASGWTKPVRYPDEVNDNNAIYSPSVARNGDLYFNRSDPVTKRERLCWSQFINGSYTKPEPLSFDDETTRNFTAAVAPDESFIIFSGHRPPSPEHMAVVFVAFAKDHKWKTPVPFKPYLLGEQTRFSPDGKTLYFTTDHPYQPVAGDATPSTKTPYRIWQITLESWAVLGKQE
jgi:Tol biopolymer transport system component